MLLEAIEGTKDSAQLLSHRYGSLGAPLTIQVSPMVWLIKKSGDGAQPML